MTSEFKETFSKSPSQNDSSTHDSLKLMPNLNTMPKRLPVHLFSFSLLVPSRITPKFKLQKSFLLYRSKKWAREHTRCNLWKRYMTWPLSLLCAYLSLFLSWYILSLKHVITEWNSQEQVNISALHNCVKTLGDTLETVGGGLGAVSCDSSLYLTESCFIFSTIFQTWRRIKLPYFVPYW